MKNVVEALHSRGFIDALTSDEITALVETPQKVYAGFDPTSDSLHLGNLIVIMGLAWFERFGHTPVALVGGATGMIGDPSGKSVERNLLDHETVEKNLQGIRRSLEAVLDNAVEIYNNYEWFQTFGYIEFLRDVGKYFRLSTMLAKESVKSRLGSEEGMSYTEFSYQLLQGYDFLHLYDTHQVTLQLGGSDQWGNITAGTELVRKARGMSVHGITFPILTRSDGRKFGKSEGGAIWLNSDKLSVYDFYQYLYRMPDADIPQLLRLLTFLDLEEIEEIEAEMKRPDYVPNAAQRRLAKEVTQIVHGQEGVREAERVTEVAKPGSTTQLDRVTLETLAVDIPSRSLPSHEVVGQKLADFLVSVGMMGSKGEARRMIKGGGIYLNNEKVDDEHFLIEQNHLIEQIFLLVSVGKKKKMVIRIT